MDAYATSKQCTLATAMVFARETPRLHFKRRRAGRMIAKILTDASGQSGIYCDEGAQPMLGSTFVCDPKFQGRIVVETRAPFVDGSNISAQSRPRNHSKNPP
jgi:hypothetical protein